MTPFEFREFEWETREPDARRERLCAVTGRQAGCRLEGASFIAAPPPEGPGELVMMAYNAERGHRADAQIALLLGDPGGPMPDIILLSEADRGCSRTGYRNVARDYAQALGMCYVFGTEFVELPRWWGPGGPVRAPCEHGNAILSRYPLGNARLLRHAAARSWHGRLQRLLRVGEPRAGGRAAVAADVRLGRGYLRLYSIHLESGRGSDSVRAAQALELAEDAAGAAHGVIIGGDANTGGYLRGAGDPAVASLRARGYADAHAALPRGQRATTDSGAVIDLILGRGVGFAGAGVYPRSLWGGLSDHLPVWARVVHSGQWTDG